MSTLADWCFGLIAYGSLVVLAGVAVGRHLKRLHSTYRRRDRRDWP